MEKKPFYYDPHPDQLKNKEDLNKDVAESARLALRNAIIIFIAFVIVAIISAVINCLKT